ncbi:hypothetical protein [Paenibacillus montanisoli]|uniref:Uncharacterized protein n=1 Tax=Paenibacillus montanisoli TaxID=2081970 RepID=A0A328TVI2_9BACL|nr:hypothetical protein [Paenibacillus montanisoli]RAP74350.1 hypothetical protein DL346_19900 [Paenibacillus montanisoli]
MKTWKIYTIAITAAFTLTCGAVCTGISYFDSIVNPKAVAEAEATRVTPTVLPNKYTLNNFEFDFKRYNSINGQKVLYNGEESSVALLPQADRAKAINSALSTPEEVAKALRYVHSKFDETLASYNHGAFAKSAPNYQAVLDYTFDERLTNQPEVYLRMADIIDNEKAAEYLRNVAALVEIGFKNRDVQAYLYAHRIIHNVDAFIIGRPQEGEEQYSAAKIAEAAVYIEKHRDGAA